MNNAEGEVFVACTGTYNALRREVHTLTSGSRNAGSLSLNIVIADTQKEEPCIG